MRAVNTFERILKKLRVPKIPEIVEPETVELSLVGKINSVRKIILVIPKIGNRNFINRVLGKYCMKKCRVIGNLRKD